MDSCKLRIIFTFFLIFGLYSVCQAESFIFGAVDNYTVTRGDMHLSTGSEVIALTQDTWAKITNGTNDLFMSEESDNNGMSLIEDELVLETSGVYFIAVTVSFSGTSGDVYNLTLFINGVTQELHHFASRKTGSNDTGNAGFSGIYVLNKDDTVGVAVQNIANDRDPTIINANCTIIKLAQ